MIHRGMAGLAASRRVLLLLLTCLALFVVPAARAEAPVVLTLRGDETPETIARMVNALSAEGRQVEIRLSGTAPAAAAEVPAPADKPTKGAKAASPAKSAPVTMPSTGDDMLSGQIDALLDQVADGISYGNKAIPSIAQLPYDWEAAWEKNVNGRTGLPAGWRILLIVALALAVAFAVRIACTGWFARRRVPAGPAFTPRLVASAYGLAQDVMTIVLALLVARIARNNWLPETDIASVGLTIAANGAAIGAFYIAVGRFLLSPGAPERQIMPLPRTGRHFRLLTLYAIVTPIIVVAILLTHHITQNPLPAAGLIALTGFATTAFKLWWFHDMRHDLAALVLSGSEAPGPLRRIVAGVIAWFYIATTALLWVVEAGAAMMSNGGRWAEAAALTEAALVILPILVVGISSLMHCRVMHRQLAGNATPLSQAGGAAAGAAAVGVIWAAGFFVIARLWAGLLLGVSSDQFTLFTRQAAGVAFLGFAGWVALVFLRAFFDAHAPKRRVIGPIGDDENLHEDSAPSRLATVLPVLRGVVLGAVVGLTILVVLARLGVDIGPLLAGFGILGLAFSFGSQTLVRDIVSGVFFMLEDAFRVGEYVDTGKLKGTVEKISLRSIQLRHQSGQIHTVPFGQISSLTNASRDWATVKFNVRLDHSADIEQARKAIKKTGIALMEDPEFGPHFIAPLKMQGVADITDSAIVVRLKFTGKPNQASMLQREALKRVYRALNEARIPFASNAVTVRGGDHGAQAGAAAMISTVPPPPPLVSAAG